MGDGEVARDCLARHRQVDSDSVDGMRNLGDDSNGERGLAEQSIRLPGDGRGLGVTVDIAEELVERIAERAAELVATRRQDDGPGGGWLRGAEKIAAYIDSPRSRVYALVSARRIPVHHDGSALVTLRSELDAWLQAGGGRRP